MNELANTLVVYPNPATDRVNIDWNGNQNVSARIIDSKGTVIDVIKATNATMLSVNVSSLAKGMYWIELSDGNVLRKASFIKK
jgi:hypothetical protein